MRFSFAASRASSGRPRSLSGSPRTRSSSGMKRYSKGSGAVPGRNIVLRLPSWSSASLSASIEPSASPSGLSCTEMTKSSWSRIPCATALRSAFVIVIGRSELFDQFVHANRIFGGRIVLEGELRDSLDAKLAVQPRLEHAVGGVQRFDRSRDLLLRAEHADVDACSTQVGGRPHRGDGDKTDTRILEQGQCLA